ncbi:uncharacterized protein PFL1_00659 [Pseudozyma flocculosa PF-1]|uniref:Uncharacterized protein n=1 Tax=Pseudozyma flocculosa TaxID=84751 RepID=A0A5C3EQS1_9BASI|nr:uncharacterized protein PFL1_00659 [Pseudozyma flocculosa PF-1]EPQ32464.1 hypothetical protein PFL1_00659 [Pseudozyma flocculosa PF-1]SPO34548.1 uncharacterized protein PSFLO_00019 [Pseudozyma flocculosa]
MLPAKTCLLALASYLALAASVHAVPSTYQRPFAINVAAPADDARLATLIGHDDVAVDYPVDAQRLSRLTPRLMPGYYNRLARKHQRQLEHQTQRNHMLHRSSVVKQPSNFLAELSAKLLGGTAEADAIDRDHNIYQPAYLTQPLDHFGNTTQATFEQKFYYSLRHYRPASQRPDGEAVPVFILDSGEAAVEARLPFLESGILDILAKATGGIGIVLEHRYYGTSTPNRTALGPGETWGTDELRWLTNKQALEDSAQFIRRLRIDGTENGEKRKVIYYGGSYPGVRSAHMRLLYPDLVHGAIASSAVVAAIDEFPEYFYPIARGADARCSQAIQAAVAGIDEILAPDPLAGSKQVKRNETEARQLLDLFGLKELTEPADLANLLAAPLGAFQSLNWDPNVTSTEFGDLCHTLTHYGTKGYGTMSKSASMVASGLSVSREVHAYAKFIRSHYVLPCLRGDHGHGGGDDDDDDGGNPLMLASRPHTGAEGEQSRADACFGSGDLSSFVNATKLTAGKAWTYQYCTTWGYIMTSPPVAAAWTKEGRPIASGPKLISTLVDYDFAHDICVRGFPKGEVNEVPPRPRVDEVNELGGFDIQMDRLAFVDGQFDPWRPATLHSEEFNYGGARPDTVLRPFQLIPHCWHHCDENGVRDPAKTAKRVQKIHDAQIGYVREWLKMD